MSAWGDVGYVTSPMNFLVIEYDLVPCIPNNIKNVDQGSNNHNFALRDP